MGGGKLLAGLGAVTASGMIGKSDPPGEPPNNTSLLMYYDSVFEEIGNVVPKDWPGWIPIKHGSFCRHELNDITVFWSDLAGYHKTSPDILLKEYLRWRCKKDGVIYDETLLDTSVICQGKLNRYTASIMYFRSLDDLMLPESAKESPKEKCQGRMPGVSSVSIIEGKPVIIKTEEEIEDEKKRVAEYTPKWWECVMDSTVNFWMLIAIVALIPFLLAEKTGRMESFFLILFIIPLIMLRYKARNNIYGTNRSPLEDVDFYGCCLISTPGGWFIVGMLLFLTIACIIGASL